MTSIAKKRKLLVTDVMTEEVVTLPGSARVTEAAGLMRERNIGTVLIVEDGLLAGIVTDRDIVTRAVAPGRDMETLTIGEIATRNPVSTRPDMHAQEAVEKMGKAAVTRLPVVDHGRVVGILSLGDLALQLEGRGMLAAVFAGQHAED